MEFSDQIFNQYNRYLELSITNRFFKHADLLRIIERLKKNPRFIIEQKGISVQGCSINLMKIGTGPVKIFLWSQMHGNEATATMALFDLFNFLNANDELNDIRNAFLENCTLYFLPLVNPDGAEVFTRRNAQEIDINRDFNAQQSPEGKLLRELHEEIQPHFGFNLHDQSVQWSAGNTGNPATISFLAPAYDENLSVNSVRQKAMQVIAYMNNQLQKLIPDHIGLFDDEYEARAFGDNFQKIDTSTILIEAGGYPNDPEKQYIRKLFFVAILSGLECITQDLIPLQSIEDYYSIPKNIKSHYHILLRNCRITTNNCNYITDIGLLAEEKLNDNLTSVNYIYLIDDVGDLSAKYGYEEIDAENLNLILTKPLIFGNPADFILQDGINTILSVENGRINKENI
ncbi:MAG: M14 family zinc carboxypeptidase [Daejeonella sp.]